MARFPFILFLRSAIFGFVCAVLTLVLVFALSPVMNLAGVYSAPVRLMIPSLTPATLEVLLNGGVNFGVVFVIIAASIAFWTVVFGAAFFVWCALSRRPTQQPPH